MTASNETNESSKELIDTIWTRDIEPALHDYIRIPNVSEAFDDRWHEHGHMQRAVDLIREWCEARPIAGITVAVHEIPERTPLIFIEVPPFNGGSADDTVLMYGHLDKQPEMVGWRDDLGPWTPVVDDGKLYGRGGADDGYAAFASLTAIEVAQAMGMVHNRIVVLIEASEESGSVDLPAHLIALRDRIGTPSLVLCLDSGCLDFDHLWSTTSLRGMAVCTLTVQILTHGVHSGEASGVVPSSFRIIRQLLDRIEDSATGELLLPELRADVPADRMTQAKLTATELDHPIAGHFPFVDGARPMVDDPVDQLLGTTWRPTLSITGVAGIPDVSIAGNVLRPETSLRLSIRLPPTCDHEAAGEALHHALTSDPPYGASVEAVVHTSPGWNAPTLEPWLDHALQLASTEYFGEPARMFGEGGSIPFMGMLGKMFPHAQFVVTGVLGPGTNAHGPNEFLELSTARKITGCLSRILAEHSNRHQP